MDRIDNANKIHNYIKNFLKSGEFYMAKEEIEVRSYTGRGLMYDKKCLGIVCNNPVELQGKLVGELIIKIIDDNASQEPEGREVFAALSFADDVKVALISRVKTDSMGTQSIIYWEDIPYID